MRRKMLIIHEQLDKDYFIDIVISQTEVDQILDGGMVSGEMLLGKIVINLGVRMPIKGEEDAVKERKVKKDNKRKHQN